MISQVRVLGLYWHPREVCQRAREEIQTYLIPVLERYQGRKVETLSVDDVISELSLHGMGIKGFDFKRFEQWFVDEQRDQRLRLHVSMRVALSSRSWL